MRDELTGGFAYGDFVCTACENNNIDVRRQTLMMSRKSMKNISYSHTRLSFHLLKPEYEYLSSQLITQIHLG